MEDPRCRHRFHWPFRHKLTPPGAAAPIELTIHQQKFAEQGFASTGEEAATFATPGGAGAAVKCGAGPALSFCSSGLPVLPA